jgi:hypothetical protein
MIIVSPPGAVPEAQRTEGEFLLRYEDVLQDGRMCLLAMTRSVDVLWKRLVERAALYPKLKAQRVAPILTRLVVRRLGGPVTFRCPLAVTGCYDLGHLADPSTGEVARLFLNLWTTLRTPDGKPVGEVFAEHTLTRPFAPQDQRKVRSLAGEGEPPVPVPPHDFHPPLELLSIPDRLPESDPTWVAAPHQTVFGLDHTDANQHVNSLVYPRFFIEEALRRFAGRGWSTALAARALDVRYRKPSFAGDRVGMASRVGRVDGEPGFVGGLWPPDPSGLPTQAQPRVTAHIVFEP